MNLIILIFLTILYYCNHSTDAFTLKGAVLPQGNYRIFVRTVPAAEVKDIDNNFNALKTFEWDSENLLGNGTIINGTKFEIDLVQKKPADYKNHPIYVQICAINGPDQPALKFVLNSLMERMLLNPKETIEYEFIYGVPINRIGIQKYLFGHILINKEKIEKCTVKMHGSKIEEVEIDTNGNFEIELEIKQPLVYEADRLPKKNYYLNFESKLKVEQPNPKLFTIDDPNLLLISGNMIDVQIHFMESRIETEVNRSVLSNSEMKKDEKRIITIRGNIVKLPDIDCSWKIKVELFKSDPRANSSQQLSAKSISEKFVNDTAIFEFKIKSDELRIKKPGFGGLFSKNDNKNNKFGPIHLMVTPVPIVKPREFQHTLTYPTLAAKSNDSDNSYRYNFGTIVYSESAVDKEEKKSMVQLYKAYLHEAKAKSMYNLAKSFVGNVDAYKLSLQMVRMRMVKDIEE